MSARPVKCRAIAGPKGERYLWTVAVQRKDVIQQLLRSWPGKTWDDLRRQYDLRVVRCTLVPEAEARDGE